MNKAKGFFILLPLLLLFAFYLAPEARAGCDAYLSWLPNSGDAGYKIYYGTTPGGPFPDAVNAGNPGVNPETGRIHWTVTGLSCDHAYYLVSTAYDMYGSESGYSQEVKFGEGTPPAPAARMFLIK